MQTPASCVVCQMELTARVVHTEGAPAVITMWKDVSVCQAHSLPNNEQIESVWCGQCGIQYHVT